MPLILNLPPNGMASIANSLNRGENPECNVNGTWNSILRHYFPPPTYIIKPEEPFVGGRPDLTVSRPHFRTNGGINWYHRVVYEGKRALRNTISVRLAIQRRIRRYAQAATTQDGRGVYGIGAIGRRVAFWYYEGGVLVPLRVQHRNVVTTPTQVPVWYDLVGNEESIKVILLFMRNNQP